MCTYDDAKVDTKNNTINVVFKIRGYFCVMHDLIIT